LLLAVVLLAVVWLKIGWLAVVHLVIDRVVRCPDTYLKYLQVVEENIKACIK